MFTKGHKLHVARIPISINNPCKLESIFSSFGNVLIADLRMLSGSVKYNIGKITYEKEEEAVRAIKELHNRPGYNLSVQFDNSYLMTSQGLSPPVPRVKKHFESRNETPLPKSLPGNINRLTNSISGSTAKGSSDIESDELANWLERSIQNDYKCQPIEKVVYQKSKRSENQEQKMFQNQAADEFNCNGRSHEPLNKNLEGKTTMENQVISPVKLTKIKVVFSKSPHDFYVQLFEEDDINSLVATACTAAIAPTLVIKNDIVGVLCGANNTWCRAKVILIDNNGYFMLQLIDYHLEVISTQDKIRFLPKYLAHKQYKVLHCSMENVAPANKTWTENDGKAFHNIVTKHDLWAVGNLVGDIYFVRLFDNKKTDIINVVMFMLDVKIVIPLHQSSIDVWKRGALVEVIIATNESPGHLWVADNSNNALQRLSWKLNEFCKTQQPSFDRNFKEGEIVVAREIAGERFWYRAIILNVIRSGSWMVQYLDFGNCEVVDEVLPLPSEFENAPAMAVSLIAMKFADRKYIRDFQANVDFELQVKLIADGINVVETVVGDKKIVFNAVSFWDEFGDVQLNSAIPTMTDNSDLPKLNESVDHSVSRNSGFAKFVDDMPEESPITEENEDGRISFFLNNCSKSFENPKLDKNIEERVSRNTLSRQTFSPQNKDLHNFELEQLASENPAKDKSLTDSLPTAQENDELLSHHFRELDNLSNSFVTQKSSKTSQPDATIKKIKEIPEQKNLRTEQDYLIIPICYDGEIYVQVLSDESRHVMKEITTLNEVCENHKLILKSVPKVSEYLCGKSNSDDCWYRCKVIKIISNNSVEVRFVDYGNTEDLELIRLAKLPEDFFKYPAVAMPIVFDDIDPTLSITAFEILLEKHSEEFCKMRIVDNLSSPLRVIVTSFDVALKDLLPPSEKGEIFSRSSSSFSESPNNSIVDFSKTMGVLQSVNDKESAYPEYYYKDAVHKHLPVGEIVEVYITETHGPESIYCWLTDTKHKGLTNIICRLTELKCAIAESINSDIVKYGPSEYIPKEGELCLAKSPLNNDWGRASCLSLSKGADNGLYLVFVDFGYIFKVDCKNIRRMRPEFMKTHIEAVFCGLDGISENAEYTKNEYDNFKKLIVAGAFYKVHVLEVKDDTDRIHIIRIPSFEKEIDKYRK